MSHADLIRDTVSGFNAFRLDFVKKLGVCEKTISDGVSKYASNDPRIIHFITFLYDEVLKEVSFFAAMIDFLWRYWSLRLGRLGLGITSEKTILSLLLT